MSVVSSPHWGAMDGFWYAPPEETAASPSSSSGGGRGRRMCLPRRASDAAAPEVAEVDEAEREARRASFDAQRRW